MTLLELIEKQKKQRSDNKLLRILNCIWESHGANRRDLCSILRLSKGAMTKNINQLLEWEFIHENDFSNAVRNKGAGRNPVELKLNDDLFYSVGIYLYSKNSKLLVMDANSNICKEVKLDDKFQEYPQERCNILLDLTEQALNDAGITREKFVGVGIALPGIVDWETGLIHSSTVFPEKQDIPLKDMFEKRFNKGCSLINVSQLLAINEHRWGKSSKIKSFLCLTPGLGMGMFFNGQFYSGWQGHAGEFGFMQVNSNSTLSVDGRVGTLETQATHHLITKKVESIIAAGGDTLVKEYMNQEAGRISYDMLVKATQNGDKLCEKLISEQYDIIARGIVNVAYLLNPEAIFLESWTAKCPKCTIDVVKRYMEHYGITNWHLKTSILSAKCSFNDSARGASLLPVKEVFNKC
jgi:N-acetylglucosamine repressor